MINQIFNIGHILGIFEEEYLLHSMSYSDYFWIELTSFIDIKWPARDLFGSSLRKIVDTP